MGKGYFAIIEKRKKIVEKANERIANGFCGYVSCRSGLADNSIRYCKKHLKCARDMAKVAGGLRRSYIAATLRIRGLMFNESLHPKYRTAVFLNSQKERALKYSKKRRKLPKLD